jgi:ubiquinone/menaquinone biosynthesis C-methylase UbiE
VTKSFFNSRAAVWDETAAEKDTNKLEAIAERLDIEPGSTVLDVGTGTGVFIPFILRRIGKEGKLVCLDFAEEMLKRAEGKGFQGDIKYVCADIEQSYLADGSFDAVVCYSSFPHLKDKPRALREVHRMLKTGGRLFICHTSSRQAINELHAQIPEVHNHSIPEETEMRQLLTAAKFREIIVCDGTDSYFVSAVKSD